MPSHALVAQSLKVNLPCCVLLPVENCQLKHAHAMIATSKLQGHVFTSTEIHGTCCCCTEHCSALICQLRGLAFLIWSAQGPDLFCRYVWKASLPDILTNVCQLRWRSSKTWWLCPLHKLLQIINLPTRKWHVKSKRMWMGVTPCAHDLERYTHTHTHTPFSGLDEIIRSVKFCGGSSRAPDPQ